ncbi:hypothetical protein Lser_V15G16140 [Lactuca serriola]
MTFFFLIIMQLGVIDFLAFSCVCKSWRLFAVSNWNKFMASTPPMRMRFSNHEYKREGYCYLEDFERRKFKTMIPHSAGRRCIGLTCGYLILFGMETKDFWLVNPITRHQLHFPSTPFYPPPYPYHLRAALVFSASISGWVFVALDRVSPHKIWFSVTGKGLWNHVHSTFPIHDLHAFKGKIYLREVTHLCELRLDAEPKLVLLETKNFLKLNPSLWWFVCSAENLCVLQNVSSDSWKLHELDFGEMKLVWQEKAIGEYAFFHCRDFGYSIAIKSESWANHPRTQYQQFAFFPNTPAWRTRHECRFFWANKWYFPHDYLNANLIDES